MILHQNSRNMEEHTHTHTHTHTHIYIHTHLILTNQFMFPLEVDE